VQLGEYRSSPTTSENRLPSKLPEDDDGKPTPKPTPFMAHDSMITVRLSEPPTLTLDTNVGPNGLPPRPSLSLMLSPSRRDEFTNLTRNSGGFFSPNPPGMPTKGPARNLQDELDQTENGQIESPTGGHPTSVEEEVNWDKLGETEELEPRVQQSDEVNPPFGKYYSVWPNWLA
jgi:hypothetical protein